MNRNWYNLIGGVVLVPVLHFGFGLLLVLLHSLIGSSTTLELVSTVYFFWLGISQLIYLIPVVVAFRRKQRFEVVKGISIGATLTMLLNGACFGVFGTAYFFRGFGADRMIATSLVVTLVLAVLTLYGFNYRKRGARADRQSSEREP